MVEEITPLLTTGSRVGTPLPNQWRITPCVRKEGRGREKEEEKEEEEKEEEEEEEEEEEKEKEDGTETKMVLITKFKKYLQQHA